MPLPDKHFSELYPKAIDEVWYKRAVEQYYVQPESFVFSVPIEEDVDEEDADEVDAGEEDLEEDADDHFVPANTTLVTASRAIFVGE